MIISVSRRTDIPSSHCEWFLERLKEKTVAVQNPFYKNKFYNVDLSKENVDIIVFWSKNPNIDFLENVRDMGYEFYIHFTITPYDKTVEKNIPNKKLLIKKFADISYKFGKEKIIWRYDPIILNEKFDADYHIKNFSYMADSLKDLTEECIFSFIQIYSKIKTVFKFINNNIDEQIELINNLNEIANKNHIVLKNCSQNFNNIAKSSCIDKERIEKILGYAIKEKKDKGQRKLCNCIKSVDIGTYNTCYNGCIYCYANSKILLFSKK